MWIQSCAGIGYLFGSLSPVMKSSLNYNQRQIAKLGVAKDIGDSIGFWIGSLCEILPLWAVLLVGALQNFIGYGWVWLIVTHRVPTLPLWALSYESCTEKLLKLCVPDNVRFKLVKWILKLKICILIFVGTNGETYFNTVDLVSCVQNFPKSRGPVVGILKGFAGPVGGHRQVRPTDDLSFTFIYGVCLLLAAYLMGVMLVQDLVHLSHTVVTIFTAILFVLILAPIVIPVSLSFFSEPKAPEAEALLTEPQKDEPGKSEQDATEVIFSEVEDEKPKEVDLLPASERQKRIAHLQAKLFQAAAEGAVRVKRRRGPHRGEDFTLMQALIKADFWLIFFSLLLGSGSGLTVIDNLGQMSQSLGYHNTHIFVSMISIWNFLGRIGGGYFSEMIVRDHAYPRPVAMAAAQVIMALGHLFFAMGWPGAMHIGTLLIGLGYGAHWAIVPAAASELFGLKNFGALYNFLTLANPAGSLVFSGVIASSIYDREAEKQAHHHHHLQQNVGSIFSGMLSMDDPPKCEGSICFFLTSMIMSGLCIIAVVLSMLSNSPEHGTPEGEADGI
ncbi:Protein nuclear fusion defective 4 [Vitis vinifera]|uniref:Protein nuclear fusion defective 4 n=1 Tax=Vitis vinifera TaxID=29760 RepID=A0A438EBA7_VITVI|nr:Protein nuclear fusion defective 4 [Vitis vinifera]